MQYCEGKYFKLVFIILWKYNCITRREHFWHNKFVVGPCLSEFVCLFSLEKERLSSWIEGLSSVKGIRIAGIILRIYVLLSLCIREPGALDVFLWVRRDFSCPFLSEPQGCCSGCLSWGLFLLYPESTKMVSAREELKSWYMAAPCDTKLLPDWSGFA